MENPEVARLALLAEVDALTERLRGWADHAPTWQPAETCRALVWRLVERTEGLRVRLEAPLVVATLGGTGTGKSALVNALVGAEVVRTGPLRPTTARPTLVCRPCVTPEMLGIDPASVEVVQRDLPGLAQVVLVDCPDPDTTEEAGGAKPQTAAANTNLERLRQILPHCDVLLVTATQQKYRSARVADELAVAARGARLVFVQTHAALDQDIRDDWRHVLADQYETGQLFLVDSLAALADAQQGLAPRGDFARLVDLLRQQLAGAAGNRIRRANFLDLVADTLAACRARIDAAEPAVSQLQAAIDQQRAKLVVLMARQVHAEYLASRRLWETRLLSAVAGRWGLSPFSLVLRIYQGPWPRQRRQRLADEATARAGQCDPTELRAAAVVLEGYAAEAGLDRQAAAVETIVAEAGRAGAAFAAETAAQLQAVILRLAQRHSGLFTRVRYEALLLAMLGLLVYRLGKNFFYDSWWAEHPVQIYGLDFYLAAGLWLALWCWLLLWAFTGRLRRGLRRQIDQLAEQWTSPGVAAALFGRLEDDCRRVGHFRRELALLQKHVEQLRGHVAEEPLGRMKDEG